MIIPVIVVEEQTLPRAWEKAVFECWARGAEIRTEYDKPEDPPSRDCTMVMVVQNPFAEPRIHRCIPCGLKDLEIYRQEVVRGIHDNWVDLSPESTKWKYTYHERLTAYTRADDPRRSSERINQLNYVINKLTEAPYTRRAIAVTWKTWLDPLLEDPPCLQYLWFRILNDRLIMNIHIRSNDAYKAAFMNMFAFTSLQRFIAECVRNRLGREIAVGQYVHVADSFHIYGSYFQQFENGFLKQLRERNFEERTWTTEFARTFFEEAKTD